jgi:hypothetical protein
LDKDTSGKTQAPEQMAKAGAIPTEGMAPEVEGHLQGRPKATEGTKPEVEGHGKPLKGTEQLGATQDQGPEVEGHDMHRP